jgi:hypothetical protein
MGRKPWWLAMMAVSVVLGCQNSSGSRRANPPAPNLSANPNPSPSTSVPRNGNAYPTTSGWNDRLPGYTAQPTSVPGTLPPNPNNPAAPVNPGIYPPVPGNPSSYPAPGGTPIQRSNYNQPTGSAPGANFPRSDASMFPSSASNPRSFSSPDTAGKSGTETVNGNRPSSGSFSASQHADTVPLPPLPGTSGNGTFSPGMTKPNGDTQMPDKYVRTTIPMVPPPPASAGTAPHVGGAESPGSQSPSGSSSRAPNNPPESLAVPPPPVPNSSGNAEPVFPSSPPPPPVH